jgi:hypothetical protein
MSNQWQNIWTHLEQNINEKLNAEIKIILHRQALKIHKEKIKKNNILTRNTSTQIQHNTKFYSRLVNNTNITFLESETKLLEQGLKYNLHYKNKYWINRLALEVNTTVNLIDPLQQNYMRQVVAIHIQKLKQKYIAQYYNNFNAKQQWKIIKDIKYKINNNNLIITGAGEGRTVVVMQKHDNE